MFEKHLQYQNLVLASITQGGATLLSLKAEKANQKECIANVFSRLHFYSMVVTVTAQGGATLLSPKAGKAYKKRMHC